MENRKEVAVDIIGRNRLFDVGTMPGPNGTTHQVVHYSCNGLAGNTSAANRASAVIQAFSVKEIIMCGIAGAIPSPSRAEDHVRLGDVVVSGFGGVVKYDYGRLETGGKWTPRHHPRPPSPGLLDAVGRLEVAAHMQQQPSWHTLIPALLSVTPGAARPADNLDVLVDHDGTTVVKHPPDSSRIMGMPRMFKGNIASSDTLLKDSVARDSLRDSFSVRAVEMEGAGIADTAWEADVGYIVVRGTCDYCNQNKGDAWQLYAACIAAAATKALLGQHPPHPQ